MIPLWLLSGAMFPLTGAHGWIRAVMLANPLTYGVESLRWTLYPLAATNVTTLATSLLILAVACAVLFSLAWTIANRRTTLPA
jgi:ABC-2 type transport system permease protein